MAIYQSMYKGAQMDAADTLSLNPDATPTENSTNLVTSGGVFSALGAVTENSAPAILNTASGAVASFEDGSASPMRSVIAQIVASQAGSGTPYPAGGGKNKLGALLSAVKTLNTGGTWTDNKYVRNGVTFECLTTSDGYVSAVKASGTASANATLVLWSRMSSNKTLPSGDYTLSGCPSGGAVPTYMMQFQATRGGSLYSYGNDTGAGVTGAVLDTDTLQATIAIGNGYAISGSLTFSPMIESGTSATTFAPYSNIRPISGYTGAAVTRAGANLFPAKKYQANANSVFLGQDNNTDTFFLRAGTYTVSYDAASALGTIYCNTGGANISLGFATSATVTFAKDVNVKFWVYKSGGVDINAISNARLNVGGSDLGYSPYVTEVFSVSWQDAAGTVYFGYIDLTTGVLTVTHKGVNLGTLAWTRATSGSVVYFRAVQADKAYGLDNILCSCYQQGTAYVSSTPDCSIAGRASSREVIVKDSTKAAMTAEEFTTAVSGQTLVYELTTAETYNLTPQEVASLLGQNNVWNDTNGDTSATYRADTKLYIQSLLGA